MVYLELGRTILAAAAAADSQDVRAFKHEPTGFTTGFLRYLGLDEIYWERCCILIDVFRLSLEREWYCWVGISGSMRIENYVLYGGGNRYKKRRYTFRSSSSNLRFHSEKGHQIGLRHTFRKKKREQNCNTTLAYVHNLSKKDTRVSRLYRP